MHDVFVYSGHGAADHHLEAVTALRNRTQHAFHVFKGVLIDLACVDQFETQSRGAVRQTADVFRTTDGGDDLRCE